MSTYTYYKKILILPDAGFKNPFQHQMINLLKAKQIDVVLGKKQKLLGLLGSVQDSNPDLIYFDWIHSFVLGKTLLGTIVKSFTFVLEILFVSYWKHIPLIHTAHNIQNHKSKFLFIEEIIYTFFLRRCDKIRTYSEAVKLEIVQRFTISPDKIHVIQDVPFHHYYTNNISKKESLLRLNLLENSFSYLFFGRIEPYKGLENLINSFLLIPQSDNYLIIAGECLNSHCLEQLKILCCGSSRIIWFPEFIPSESVQYFFNASDVVVLPFTSIDHSGSIDLSMSFSKPVITLKTPAITEILKHQNTLLFGEPSELVNCLLDARQLNLDQIGTQNFTIADSTNFAELPGLFRKIETQL